MDFVLVLLLEKFRRQAGDQTITLTSGFRCESHNRSEGGEEFSYHLTGQAADIRHAVLTPKEVYRMINSMYPKKFGLGLYVKKNFVHVDSGPFIHPRRGTMRRWRGD